MKQFDVVVVGAGAAGLFCAIEAGRRGRRVLVIEHNHEPGRKILISGGGRCNFTNVHCGPDHFQCSNPHFHKSALAGYGPEDFVGFIEKHRIRYHEKKLGQLFCDGSARQVVDALLVDRASARVVVLCDCDVQAIAREEKFFLRTNQGEFCAESVVIATGGLSIPKLGASPFGYEIARQFGHKIVPPRPALVPLLF
ncbi:MAG: aminoacetone oxidase family FAD-binding enzyme, partial [Acidobacteriaceae bacterium]|nr:aminoacetone oxidase family FAD-binding enzyme [Acidobacteriaceae bacterium]